MAEMLIRLFFTRPRARLLFQDRDQDFRNFPIFFGQDQDLDLASQGQDQDLHTV